MDKPFLNRADIVLTVVSILVTFVVLSVRTGHDNAPVLAASVPPAALVEVQDGFPLPDLSLELVQDPEHGWNAVVTAGRFRLLPDGTENDVESGYAYLAVDGGPRTRLYSQWNNLPTLADGAHTLELSVTDEEFHPLSFGGDRVAVKYQVTIKGDTVDLKEVAL